MPPRYGPESLDRLRLVLPDDRGDLTAAVRPAAVLIPLFTRDDELHVVLTKRSSAIRRHRGEVSFPGGGWEPGDPSLAGTALREAQEEVGLAPADVEILGILGDMPTATTGWLVRPFVARIPFPYDFVPDPREVERVFHPPLHLLADPGRRRDEIWERGGVRFPVHFFDVDGEVVWGLTARLLVVLLDRIEGREPGPLVLPPEPPPED